MKVAVYTIALNEQQFVERWYNSAKGADHFLIADTGSTDQTVQKARALSITVHEISVKPWRFDVARNASLALLPADIDYCIQLDMDEILVGDWRDELEKAYKDQVTVPRYRMICAPHQEFAGYRIHKRHNIVWRYPIHEAPYTYGDVIDKHAHYDFAIEHHPDVTKSRGQYLPMLESAVKEYPKDARMEFYLGREYYYHQKWAKAYKHLQNAINLEFWDQVVNYDLAALTAYHCGHYSKALEFGMKAVELNPSDKRLQDNLKWYEGSSITT